MRLLAFLLFSALLRADGALASRVQAEALAYVEAQVAGRGGAYAFRTLQPPNLPPLRPGTVNLEISHLSKQEPTGRFFVAVKLSVDGRLAGTARVDLEGRWNGELLRAKNSLPRKQALEPDHFEKVAFEGQPPAGALLELPEGMRLRQPLQAGKWLIQADLEAIPLVNAGEPIRLRAEAGALVVEAEALARSSGALGERIRLEMPNRKRLTATVTGVGSAIFVLPK